MQKASIQIDYPTALPDALHTTPEAFVAEAKMAMAVKLFEMRRLSSGQAAQLAGISRVAFLLNLHRFGVAMIDLSEEELRADVENA
jgi:predicted HTH domain antitoxin